MEKVSETMATRLTPSEADAIRYLAAAEQRRPSDWIRRRLVEALADFEDRRPEEVAHVQ